MWGDTDFVDFLLLDKAYRENNMKEVVEIAHFIIEFYPAYPQLKSILSRFWYLPDSQDTV